MQSEAEPVVTQADRDAAIGYLHSGKQPPHADVQCMADDIAAGHGDHYQLVQAFVRHREVAVAEAVGIRLDLTTNDLVRLYTKFSQAADLTQVRDQRIHDVLRAALVRARTNTGAQS
jgi:hypothetical protein